MEALVFPRKGVGSPKCCSDGPASRDLFLFMSLQPIKAQLNKNVTDFSPVFSLSNSLLLEDTLEALNLIRCYQSTANCFRHHRWLMVETRPKF